MSQYTDTFVDVGAPHSLGLHGSTISSKPWAISTGALTVTVGHNAIRSGTLGVWDVGIYEVLQLSANEECSVDVHYGTMSPFVAGSDFVGAGVVARMTAPTGGNGYGAYVDCNPSNTHVTYGIAKLVGGTVVSSIGTESTDPIVTVAQVVAGTVTTIRIKLYFNGNTIKVDRSLDGGATWLNVRSETDSTYPNAGYSGLLAVGTQAPSDTAFERLTNFNLGPVYTPSGINPNTETYGYLICTEGDAYNGLAFAYSSDGIHFEALFNGESQYTDSTYGIRDPALTRWNGRWYVVYSPAGSAFGKTDSRRLIVISSPDLKTWTSVATIGPSWVLGGTTYNDSNDASDLYIDVPIWIIDGSGLHICFQFDEDPQYNHQTVAEIHPTATDLSAWSKPVRLTDNTSTVLSTDGNYIPIYLGGGKYAAFENNVSVGNAVRRWTSTSLTSGWTLQETFSSGVINNTTDIELPVLTATGHILLHLDSYGAGDAMTGVQSTDTIGHTWGTQVPLVFTGLTPISVGQLYAFPAAASSQRKKTGIDRPRRISPRALLDFPLPPPPPYTYR